MNTRDWRMLCILMTSCTGLLGIPDAQAQEPPVQISSPVAPYFSMEEGTGLCMLTAFSTDLSRDFGDDEIDYPSNANTFFLRHRTNGTVANQRVVRTLLDFANVPLFGDIPDGDFVGADPSCPGPGCVFFPPICPPDFQPVNAQGRCDNGLEPITPQDQRSAYRYFGSRFRGYLNVPPEWVGAHVYFGLHADAGAYIVLYDGNAVPHTINSRPIAFGVDAWITANTVVFEAPGLYPMELIFTTVGDGAILELSYFLGTDDSLRQESNAMFWTGAYFNELGFQPFSPDMFFQTLSGTPSFDDPGECQQCRREFVNIPGSGGECDGGYYCNEAALCAPCDTARFCGLACIPCGGTTPNCGDPGGGYECVECLDDDDCEDGFLCDPNTLSCQECNVDADCPRGNYCLDHQCLACDTSDSCAGNSCNCCPAGPDGVPMQCAAVGGDDLPACVECVADSDCGGVKVCDLVIGRCVDELRRNERPDCCGPNCLECPTDHPHCLPGPLGTACAECRWDTDCAEGTFCQSGECLPCDEDRRCGAQCLSCAGETPYCKPNVQMPELSTCVECMRDADCDGAPCDLATNTCVNDFACTLSCDGATPNCFGDTCVECYADVHCPCGGVCDRSNNTCLTSCRSNGDCMGYEHCAPDVDADDKSCKVGPSVVQSPCGALATSCISFACSVGTAPPGEGGGRPLGVFFAALAALLIVSRIRRRGGTTC